MSALTGSSQLARVASGARGIGSDTASSWSSVPDDSISSPAPSYSAEISTKSCDISSNCSCGTYGADENAPVVAAITSSRWTICSRAVVWSEYSASKSTASPSGAFPMSRPAFCSIVRGTSVPETERMSPM